MKQRAISTFYFGVRLSTDLHHQNEIFLRRRIRCWKKNLRGLTRCLAWSWRNNWWEWYKWWQKRRVDGWGHVWRSFVWDGTEREAIRPSARKTGISSRPWKWQWMSSCPGSRDQCHRWECWQALEETRRSVEAGRFLQNFSTLIPLITKCWKIAKKKSFIQHGLGFENTKLAVKQSYPTGQF